MSDDERDRILGKMAAALWRIDIDALGEEDAAHVKGRMAPLLEAIESVADVVPRERH